MIFLYRSLKGATEFCTGTPFEEVSAEFEKQNGGGETHKTLKASRTRVGQ